MESSEDRHPRKSTYRFGEVLVRVEPPRGSTGFRLVAFRGIGARFRLDHDEAGAIHIVAVDEQGDRLVGAEPTVYSAEEHESPEKAVAAAFVAWAHRLVCAFDDERLASARDEAALRLDDVLRGLSLDRMTELIGVVLAEVGVQPSPHLRAKLARALVRRDADWREGNGLAIHGLEARSLTGSHESGPGHEERAPQE